MKWKAELFIALLHLATAFGAPSATESWVTISTEPQTSREIVENDSVRKLPKISSMKVETNVTNRFATSLVTSKVKNLDTNPQEATFSVVLPDTAYISGFVMEIDGKKYEAYIQEKEQAKKTYNEAVSSGFAAGHVAVNARDSNKFTVSVNIMPESKATFYLTYEELLSRQKEVYDIVVNLHPGQPVKDMEVQVNINETRPLTSVTTPSLRSGNEISKTNEILDPKAEIELIGNNSAKVIFKPDMVRQKEFAKELGTEEDNGFAGQFVVQYDVERDPEGGELLFADGYFVHFFAPKDVKPEPKYISFILDTSGSMWGTRITQLKEAMKNILDQLNTEDSFNIIDFNSLVNVWNVPNTKVQYKEGEEYPFYHDIITSRKDQVLPDSFKVSAENIEKAKRIVDLLNASGGTNIDAALETALKLHKNNKEKDKREPIIMFLTDGDATVGETNSDVILSKVSKGNTDDIPIISISFGEGADRALLEKLSLRNHGFARHIYEGADAALQLKSFYDQISSPLFNKIHFKYTSENVSEVTKTHFPILFKGSELVVAGKYNTPPLDPGFAPKGPFLDVFADLPMVNCYAGPVSKDFKPKTAKPIGSLEKHWAYLSLKQILKERDAADKKDELTKKALNLALKYSFVTPVSSLVVVKPNDTKSESHLQDASKGSSSRRYYRPTASYASPPGFAQPLPARISSFDNMLSSRFSLNSLPNMGFAAFDSIDSGFVGQSGYMRVTPSLFLYPSTPAFASTTEKLISEAISTIDKLKKELPWFDRIYHAENGSLSLPQGNFMLGNDDQNVEPYPECQKTPVNGTGHCVLLKDCPQVYTLLQSILSYTEHFCPLGKFAGVCCPTIPTKIV